MRSSWILVCAGINLILAQYWTMKEYLLVMTSSEVSILIAASVFIASGSFGYWLAPAGASPWVPRLAVGVFALHLAMPWMIKALTSVFFHYDVPHLTFWLAGFGLVVMAPLYTVILPMLVEARECISGTAGAHALVRCYGFELFGALLGIGVILVVGRSSHVWLLVIYFAVLAVLIGLLFDRPRAALVCLPVALSYGLLYEPLDRFAAQDLYRIREQDASLQLLDSAQSLYNRIDIATTDDGGLRLFMNGREYFNPTDLEIFNRYLSGLPSELMPGSRVLIIGTGSMSSVYHASRHAASVESVEIDEQVVRLTRNRFRAFNHLDHVHNWTLHIDDAKHFLGSTAQQYDLIVVDLVPPVYVQTALLFSKEFYELAKRRLSPTGVLSIYTGHLLDKASMADTLYSPIATIEAVFPEYLVVSSRAGKNGFVYASSKLPFGRDDVARLLVESTRMGGETVLTREEVRPLLAGTKVTSMDDLGIVMEWAPSPYREPLSRLGNRP